MWTVCLGQEISGNKICLSNNEMIYFLQRENDATLYEKNYNECKFRDSVNKIEIQNYKEVIKLDSNQIDNGKENLKLEKEKTSNLEEKIKKQAKKINNLKIGNKVLGGTTSVTIIIILILLI